MSRFLLVVTLGGLLAAVPSGVDAQPPPAAQLDDPRPMQPTAPPGPTEPDPTGWGFFGAELGFFSGVALGGGVIVMAIDQPDLAPVAIGAVLVGVPVLTIAGAMAGHMLARDNAWNGEAGWGAAGAVAGLAAGALLSSAVLQLSVPSPAGEARLAGAAAGAAIGAVAGYLAFRAMALARGSALGELIAFWMAFLSSEVVSIVAVESHDLTPAQQSAIPLLTVAASSTLTATVAHFLLR